jgi:ACS family sodium-dependent inorganic phosphate cotransporter
VSTTISFPLYSFKVDERKDTIVDQPRVNNDAEITATTTNNQSQSMRQASLSLFDRLSPAVQTPNNAIEDDETYYDYGNKQDKLVMFVLLWVTACLSALDRVAMSVAMVPMTEEFGLTDTMKGSISSFFSVGYGIGIIPAGILLSFASPRLVMSMAVVAWSLATLVTPIATESLVVGTTASTLLFIRALVGAAESFVVPTLQRILLSWTTAEEKATGVATVVSGFQAGTIAAYLLSPVLMDSFGDGNAWRQLFYVYGGAGLVLLLPWLFIAKDEPDRLEATAIELQRKSSEFPTSPD